MKALILSACLAQVSFMTFLAWAAFSAFAPGSTSTQSSLENIAETPASDLQDLAMCLNVKDEASYVREWVVYHQALGVSHFYIHENNSTQSVRGEVEDFIKAGLVTYSYHAWSGFEGSTPIAARLCLDDHGQDHAWMGFIDVDEYVVLRQGHSSLPEFLKAYVNYAALKVYRRPIHYSGHEKRPQAFTLSAFTQCLPQEQGNWLKSFVQPKYTSNAGMSSHHFQHTQGRKPVSSDFELESDWSGSKHLEDKIVLFHYEYRSVEEYSAKIARHSVGGNFRANMDWFLHTAAQATENCTDLEHWWELHPFNCLVYDAQAVSRQTN